MNVVPLGSKPAESVAPHNVEAEQQVLGAILIENDRVSHEHARA